MKTRRATRLMFPLFVTLVASLSSAEDALNFSQILDRALEQSIEYKSLRLQKDSSELAEKNAWWAMAPTLDLSASHSYLQLGDATARAASTAYPWSSQAGLNISENLYDNGNTWRTAEVASRSRQIENLNSERGRARLLVDVAKSFYEYSNAAVSMELRRQQLEALRVQFNSIQSRYRQGLQSNRDYLRIQAQMQSSEISLLNSQLQLNSNKTTLRSLLGEFGSPEFLALNPMSEKTSPDISTDGLDPERSFEFRIAELQKENSELRFESVRRTYWPTLSVQGSFDYVIPQYLGSGQGGSTRDAYWNLQATLLMQYRLWDWGSRGRNVGIAENAKQIEINGQDIVRLRVQKNVEELRLQARLLLDSFKANQQMLKANESAYQSLNTAYREGKVTYLELITSLSDLYSARQQDLNLRFNILKLKAELAYYQGNVDEVLKPR